MSHCKIENIDGFYVVLSPIGKRLGGPFEHLQEAYARRDQVNRHTEKAKSEKEKK